MIYRPGRPVNVGEEPPFCGRERGNSGCWVQISNSGVSFQTYGLQGLSQGAILNVGLFDSG